MGRASWQGARLRSTTIGASPLPSPLLPSPSPMPRTLLAVALLALLAPVHAAQPRADLTTESERSGFVRTGRYERGDRAVRCLREGAIPTRCAASNSARTPEGRPMQALVVSRSGALTPEAARAKGLPVLLVQGGIHAGEIDGKDAGFLALRELLDGDAGQGRARKAGARLRPGVQRRRPRALRRLEPPQPARPRADGLAHHRAELQPQPRLREGRHAGNAARCWRLVDAWDPIAYIDLHVTDGAKFQHDVAVQVEPVHAGDAALRTAGRAFRDAVIADITQRRRRCRVAFYPSFVEQRQPGLGLRRRRVAAALFHRLFPAAQPLRRCWSKRIRGATTRIA